MGNGSRLLIGSIYKLFYGDYLDVTVAYKYVGIGIMLTILVLAIVLGQLIRLSLAQIRNIGISFWSCGSVYRCSVFDYLCME